MKDRQWPQRQSKLKNLLGELLRWWIDCCWKSASASVSRCDSQRIKYGTKNPPSATRNNRNVDRKWSRLCIQHLKPNSAGVGKIFEELRSCGNYKHLVEHSIGEFASENMNNFLNSDAQNLPKTEGHETTVPRPYGRVGKIQEGEIRDGWWLILMSKS